MTGYKFDNFEPEIGEDTCVFKSLLDLKKFIMSSGANAEEDMRYWKITGKFVADEGGPDGLILNTEEYDEIYL